MLSDAFLGRTFLSERILGFSLWLLRDFCSLLLEIKRGFTFKELGRIMRNSEALFYHTALIGERGRRPCYSSSNHCRCVDGGVGLGRPLDREVRNAFSEMGR